MKRFQFLIFFLMLSWATIAQQNNDVYDRVEHHYATNQEVKIHYVTLGDGPVMIMLHGFPDYWYTWRYQMAAFSSNYKVVAIDLRGYNLSDKPKGVESYTMRILMQDIIYVLDDLNEKKSIIMANDWGGAIAWQLATYYPNRVDKLIACNIPHAVGLRKYLQDNPNTGQYAQDYKKEKASESLSVAGLLSAHDNLSDYEKARYRVAFQNSDLEAMLNYYKANYPTATKNADEVQKTEPRSSQSKIQCKVLIIYGVLDKALPPGMLNDTWDLIDNDLTIFTIHDGGHFIQQEKPEKVNKIILAWMNMNE